ncbi:MAG: hypothetical protein R3D56_05830 [Paracoccaceae bacterium]|jgi:hypothetical protein
MFRILKALITLAIVGLIGLVAFAYLGDLSPEQGDVVLPVELNVDQN